MTRILRSGRLALAAMAGFLAFGSASFVSDGTAVANSSVSGTALPPAWELCILQGLGAPATSANIVNLDEWQAAEGGSTNNSAAYNPFNTLRTTDVNNAPLPLTISSNGFPAYANWLAGCSATVATLLQPNMWSITAALRAGNVSPPGTFLAAVDASQWCAPSNGVPCYANAILGSANQLLPALLTTSSALQVYGNVQLDLTSYARAVTSVATDQGALAASNAELVAAEAADKVAQDNHAAAERALRKFAISEYVSSGLYATSLTSLPNATAPSGGPSPDGVVAQEYTKIAASDIVAHTQAARAALKAAQARRDAAFKGVGRATAILAADDALVTQALGHLVSDVATMQHAGACTAVVLTSTPPDSSTPSSPATPGAPGASSGGQGTPSSSTTTAPPTTTTTTTAPPTTTTTLLSPSVPSGPVLPTTTTTVAPPTTTTTTTAPPTTTTTTTAPSAAPPVSGTTPGAAPATANPVGLGVLQGCISTLAPTGTA